jgi:hypothetical protein
MKGPGADAQSLITWPEGNGRLVRHLYEKTRARVRLGLAVADVRTVESDAVGSRGGVEVVAVGRDGRGAVGFRAERVVFAAPQFLTKYLLKSYREGSCPPHVAEFEYGAWMVANLFLSDRPRAGLGFPAAWDNVLYESPSLGYVTATHQRGLERGPTVFTYYYPLTEQSPRDARARLLSANRDEWAEVTLSDLSRAHRDIRALTRRLDVMRWGHAMIRPRVGFQWGGARLKAQQPFGPIHFAHTDLSGVPLFEEAFDHGLRAAEEVLAARGLPSATLR